METYYEEVRGLLRRGGEGSLPAAPWGPLACTGIPATQCYLQPLGRNQESDYSFFSGDVFMLIFIVTYFNLVFTDSPSPDSLGKL